MATILICGGLVCIIALILPRLTRYLTVKRWYRRHHLKQHALAYHQLFHDVNGFELSKLARGNHSTFADTYGEIDFISFIALLSQVKPNEKTIFYDLGSGIGTAAIAVAMVFPVKKSCGIERLASLHDTALRKKRALQTQHTYANVSKKLHFLHADFMQAHFSDASLIFINATALFGEEWEQLCTRITEQTCAQTVVITTSKKITLPSFLQIKQVRVQMSWGIIDAYIQVKQ